MIVGVRGGNWQALKPIADEVIELLRQGKVPELEYFDPEEGSFGFHYRDKWVEVFGSVLRVADKKGVPFNDLLVLKDPRIGRLRRKALKKIGVRA